MALAVPVAAARNKCQDVVAPQGLVCLSSGTLYICKNTKLAFYGGLRKAPLLRELPLPAQSSGKSRNVMCKSTSELEPPDVGTRKLWKLPETLGKGRNSKNQTKDNDVVFVAGATGKVGSRTVRELLKLGFRVRAGVRNIDKAKELLKPAKLFEFFIFPREEQLKILECDLEVADEIDLALGNAGIVICCVGASEKEILDVTGPYRIDYQATKNLIEAATRAQVNHFVLVTSLGTTKFGWPAAVLNLFWGVLIWKGKAEKALQESGLPYTIVRPGGMERPTDAYKETHNLRIALADSLSGGQVSNLQVAELLACIAKNRQLAEDKILEVIAETTAPLRPIEEMLAEIPKQSRDDIMVEMENTDSQYRKSGTQKLVGSAGLVTALLQWWFLVGFGASQIHELPGFFFLKKKRQIDRGRQRGELLKYKGELQALKEEEIRTSKERLALQNKRAEVLEQVKTATRAASEAKALADALTAAANEGQIMTEEEKQKILKSVRAETLSEKKPESQPATEALPFSPPLKSKRVSEQPLKSQQITMQQPPKTGPKSTVPQASTPGEKIAETSVLMAKPFTADLDGKDSAEAPQSTYNSIPQMAGETSKQPTAIFGETIIKVNVSSKEPIVKSAEISDEYEKAEERKSETASQMKPQKKSFRWFWQEEPKLESWSSNGTAAGTASVTQEGAYSEPLTASLSPSSRNPDLSPPTSPLLGQPDSTKYSPQLDAELEEETTLTLLAEGGLSKASGEPKLETEIGSGQPDLPKYSSQLNADSKEEIIFTLPSDSKEVSKAAGDSKLETEIKQLETPASAVTSLPTPPLDRIETEKAAEEYAKASAERESLALGLARAQTSLKWLWEKPFSDADPSRQVPSTPEIEALLVAATPVMKGTPSSTNTDRPLSPYARYPELKPPTSPTPSPPNCRRSSSKLDFEQEEVTSVIPLEEAKVSMAVGELEPAPETIQAKLTMAIGEPEPVIPEFGANELIVTKIDKGETSTAAKEYAEASAAREALALKLARAQTSLTWLWQTTESTDLDHPQLSLSFEIETSLPTACKVIKPTTTIVERAQPLSPYTRYPDLKPPTSPTPFPPKMTKTSIK